MAEHPITPPEATVLSLRNSAPHGIGDFGATRELWLINHAYAAGADQELEACVKWIEDCGFHPSIPVEFRAARRPKPPSLKEQALHILDTHGNLTRAEADTIRRALEALSDD